jgi:chromosome partitioning protein
MRTIAVLNQKGGVGKTTSTINIGAGLTRLGKRVLLIDFDPQASLTYSLGIDGAALNSTIFEVLKGEASFESTVVRKNKLTILPASIALSGFEISFANIQNREFILKNLLEKLTEFEYILIDCPPSLGLLTLNALAAAQEVYIPVQTEFLALQGLSQLLDTLTVVNKRINKSLKLGGIIGTRYNRRKINRDVVHYLENSFKDKFFKTVIRENVSLTEAPSFGQDVYTHNPQSQGAEDYLMLCKEILKAAGTPVKRVSHGA